jgi:hypothetical protein
LPPKSTTACPASSHARKSVASSAASRGACTANGAARKDLVGVERARDVENFAQAGHRREIAFVEHEWKRLALLGSDAVFARDRSAEFDARGEDVVARMRHRFELPGNAAVEEQQRMQVAVARMKDVADLQAAGAGDLLDAPRRERKFRARNGRVLNVVVRRDAPERAGRALARRPQRVAFARARGRAPRECPVFARDARDRAFPRLDVGGLARDLDEEHGAGIERKSRVKVRFDRLHDRAVDDLERRRRQAGRDDRGHRFGSTLDVAEGRDAHADRARNAQQPDVDRGHDAEGAFASHERSREIVAGVVERHTEHLARVVDEFESEHVRAHRTVGEGVRAARVRRGVPADRRGLLARGIRTEEEPRPGDPIRELEVGEPGLDARAPLPRVEREHAVHPGERDHDAAVRRHGAAAQTRARAARHDGAPAGARDADDRADVARVLRKHDGRREPALTEGIERVRRAIFDRRLHPVRADGGDQSFPKLVVRASRHRRGLTSGLGRVLDRHEAAGATLLCDTK